MLQLLDRQLRTALLVLVLCSQLCATTYYMRGDGSAANKAAATSCASASTAMNVTTHNAQTFSPDDVITLCDSGGAFTDAILTPPSSGSSGHVITYTHSGSPVVSAANQVTSWTQGGGASAEEDCSSGPCIFVSGMETGGAGFTDWTLVQTQATTHVTQSSSAPCPAHGTFCAKMTADVTTDDRMGLQKSISALVAGTPRYFREYVYLPSGAIMPGEVLQTMYSSDDGAVSVQVLADGSGNVIDMGMYCKTGWAPQTNITPVTFAMDAWHYIDVELLVGTTTSNGGCALWLDGTPVGQDFSLDTTAMTDVLHFGPGCTNFGHGLAAGQSYYFDDWKEASAGPIGEWVSSTVPSNVWTATLTTQPPIVAVNGVVSLAHGNFGGLATNQWFWAGNTLYVGSPTSPTSVWAAVRDYAVHLPHGSNISYVTFDGIAFEYAALINVLIDEGDHDTVKNCTITGAYMHGIWAFGYASPPGTLSNFLADNNTVSYNGSSGIEINSRHNHVTVTHNTVHHNAWNPSNTAPYFQFMGGIYVFDNQAAPNYDLVAYNLSYSNGVFGGNASQGAGIWLDTVYNSTMEYNLTHDNAADGIFLEASVNSAMVYNVSYGDATNPYTSGMHSYASTFTASGNTIANNTVYGSHWWGTQLGVYTGASVHWNNNGVNNNIVLAADSTDVYFDHAALNDGSYGSGNTYANNAFGTPAATFWMLSIAYGTPWVTSYTQFNTFYGADAHSVTTTPTFTDAAGHNFTLAPASSAINSGVNLGPSYQMGLDPRSTWPNGVLLLPQNQDGAGWDIGAFMRPKHCKACEASQ